MNPHCVEIKTEGGADHISMVETLMALCACRIKVRLGGIKSDKPVIIQMEQATGQINVIFSPGVIERLQFAGDARGLVAAAKAYFIDRQAICAGVPA
ncbi:hypothetical protein HNP46_006520 [Pseudomonas nitritireducens]|uniref:Uncharacterized protein n=1 Tax=Pseudomonas nitroreducens TaxID=46680 RepID=A0A7W7P4D6_PSENT|nr:hypothetical protein [Pseudomonas nitritireducens]MBB4867606.1 hypothetical protein [Pseudomonas nitritireducens]